tara:strand:- start:829 stop:1077 length:249 start_codon:yes stop_codon:yes gene_type:complete
MIEFNSVYESTVVEKDEHRKSRQYKKLSPKMRNAVDDIFKIMDSKPSDFLNSFEKTIKDVSKKFKVSEKELMNYFEKEMLSI